MRESQGIKNEQFDSREEQTSSPVLRDTGVTWR